MHLINTCLFEKFSLLWKKKNIKYIEIFYSYLKVQWASRISENRKNKIRIKFQKIFLFRTFPGLVILNALVLCKVYTILSLNLNSVNQICVFMCDLFIRLTWTTVGFPFMFPIEKSHVGIYLGNYLGNYVRNYIGNYMESYMGNYAGNYIGNNMGNCIVNFSPDPI